MQINPRGVSLDDIVHARLLSVRQCFMSRLVKGRSGIMSRFAKGDAVRSVVAKAAPESGIYYRSHARPNQLVKTCNIRLLYGKLCDALAGAFSAYGTEGTATSNRAESRDPVSSGTH